MKAECVRARARKHNRFLNPKVSQAVQRHARAAAGRGAGQWRPLRRSPPPLPPTTSYRAAPASFCFSFSRSIDSMKNSPAL